MVSRAAIIQNIIKLKYAVKCEEINMDRIFKIEQIEGKNLGCIALTDIKKGTLILQEKPQVIVNGSGPSLIYLLNSYNQMNETTQKDYLTLYNRFKDLNDMNEKDKENVKQEMEWLQQNLNFDHKVLQRIQGKN